MSHIVLFDQNARSREQVATILRDGFPSETIHVCSSFDMTSDLLKRGIADLLIVDVPRFTYAFCSLLSGISKTLPGVPVLVTSTASRTEVSGNVWRLGVTDYLLKPYRPDWLVAAVHAMLARPGQDARLSRMDWRRERYVCKVGEYLHAYKYKKCIEATREYVDSLFDSLENDNEIAEALTAFAKGLIGLADGYGPTARNDASTYFERVGYRFSQVGARYDAYSAFENLVGRLFDLAEKEGLPDVDAFQRVMTKLDRSVHSEITLVEIAKFANMSPSYFSKWFKRESGTGFVSYVTDAKLEYACLMLTESDMTVIQIARDLSYNGANYFSKAFKKKLGMTPTEYRELHDGSHNGEGVSPKKRGGAGAPSYER